ncbi:MAG: T9SS type A sorting domain-containing protein [Dysgonomonas sp.]
MPQKREGITKDNEIPDKIPLTFNLRINDHNIDKAYNVYEENQGVRIGEYYWSDVFSLDIPFFKWWATEEGPQSKYPPSKELFDLYMKQIHIDYEKFNPDVDEFNEQYGIYYDRFTTAYMRTWGIMYEDTTNIDMDKILTKEDIAEKQGESKWREPSNKDYRQLFAMCPFYSRNNNRLDELDVRHALSRQKGETSLAYDISNGTSFRTYWFDVNNTNLYGFNMMPGGMRLHAEDASWSNGLVDNNGNVERWVGPRGGFALMFYTVFYHTCDGQAIIHDRIDTETQTQYVWMNMRYRKKLTDEELGYKLFISVKNIDETCQEWIELSKEDGNEMPLLQQIKLGKYESSDIDIIKIDDPKAIAPDGYAELPNGYIRGFYVQYFIENKKKNATVQDVVLYAQNVDDNALDVPQNPTGIDNENAEKNFNIKIYPNPAKEVLYVDSPETISDLNIFTISGAKIKNVKGNANPINISDLKKGIYILEAISDKTSYKEKIIIK